MEFWKIFCNEIEAALIAAQVIPNKTTEALETWSALHRSGELSSSQPIGITRMADVRIEGSRYISYRNDRAKQNIAQTDYHNKSVIYSRPFNRTGEPVIFMDLEIKRPRASLTH